MKEDTLQLLLEIFEDADVYRYIVCKAHVDVYDPVATIIFRKINKDYTIAQLQKVIWEAFYQWLCVAKIGGSDDPFVIDREYAQSIVGDVNRFKGIAANIRNKIYEL